MTNSENEMTQQEARSSLLNKISNLRNDVMSCNWEGDKMISVGGNSYIYVSSPKMRRNFAPLLRKNGLEIDLRYYDLKQLPALQKKEFHWCISLDVTLTDCDTGATKTYTVYGESSDNTDKGIAMAQTIALRQWVLQEFLVTDGFDPEDLDSASSGKTFTPKSPSEEEDVRSKVLSKGLRSNKTPSETPEVKVEAPKVEVKTESPRRRGAVNIEKKKGAPAEESKGNIYGATQQQLDTEKDDLPVQGSGEVNKVEDLDFLTDAIPAIHQATIEKIVKTWSQAAEEGKVDAGEYNNMSLECASIKTAGDASKFIRDFRRTFE